MAGNQDIVFETIEKPDKIIEGDKSERFAVKYYPKTSISEKHVVVIYKEQTIDGFVITAFMTSKPEKIIKKGVIWKSSKYIRVNSLSFENAIKTHMD